VGRAAASSDSLQEANALLMFGLVVSINVRILGRNEKKKLCCVVVVGGGFFFLI
jgi:hypothetical protein